MQKVKNQSFAPKRNGRKRGKKIAAIIIYSDFNTEVDEIVNDIQTQCEKLSEFDFSPVCDEA